MSRHVNADLLARYREGVLSARRAGRIGRHLSGCASCTALGSDLAAISSMLASVRLPVMPDRLAARLQLAIAGESAARAVPAPGVAGRPGTAPADPGQPATIPGRPDLPERSRHRARRPRMRGLSSPLLLRGLAVTGAVVVIAGAGFLIARGPAGTSTTEGGAKPAASRPAIPGSRTSTVAGTTTVNYRRDGKLTSATVRTSSVNYTPSTLGPRARKQLASSAEPLPSQGVSNASPADGKKDISGFSVPRFEGCLTRIAAGRKVLLAEVATYLGKPAAIIALQPLQGADVLDVVAVGLSCSGSDSDILGRAMIAKAVSG